jgi:hypothetical protein
LVEHRSYRDIVEEEFEGRKTEKNYDEQRLIFKI